MDPYYTFMLFFLLHCRVHQMCRVPQHGLLWLDSVCETSPLFLQPNWGETWTNNHTFWNASDVNVSREKGPLFILVAHLAESVIVMSDTSILRQFSTLSRTGLLTLCVWGAETQFSHWVDLNVKNKTGKVIAPSSPRAIVCSSACIFHPAEGRCTAWYRSSDGEHIRRK